MMGKDDEDHEAALVCNIMFYMHSKEMIEKGLLPAELDDMIPYEQLNSIEDYFERLRVLTGTEGKITKYDKPIPRD